MGLACWVATSHSVIRPSNPPVQNAVHPAKTPHVRLPHITVKEGPSLSRSPRSPPSRVPFPYPSAWFVCRGEISNQKVCRCVGRQADLLPSPGHGQSLPRCDRSTQRATDQQSAARGEQRANGVTAGKDQVGVTLRMRWGKSTIETLPTASPRASQRPSDEGPSGVVGSQ